MYVFVQFTYMVPTVVPPMNHKYDPRVIDLAVTEVLLCIFGLRRTKTYSNLIEFHWSYGDSNYLVKNFTGVTVILTIFYFVDFSLELQ